MSEELISIVIPTYNRALFTVEAIETAIAQTYQTTEIIVVDDGSTDQTKELLRPYRDQINYVYQENQGVSAARNHGIRLARGDWIAYLDADDLWHPKKLELQMNALREHPDCVLIGSPPSGIKHIIDATAPHAVTRLTVSDFLLGTPFGPTSAIIAASTARTLGSFDESLSTAEDRDVWLRVAAKKEVLTLQTPLWSYRRHAGQISKSPERTLENYKKVLNKFFSSHDSHSELRKIAYAYMYLDAAMCFYEERNRWQAICNLFRSVVWHPKSMGAERGCFRVKIAVKFLLGEAIFSSVAKQRH